MGCSNDDDQGITLCDDFPLMVGNYDNSEDFEILDAIANSILSQNGSSNEVHLVQETETSYSAENVADDLDARGIDYDASSINDYGIKNATSAFFTNSPNEDRILLISEQELSCLFLQDVDNTQLGFMTKYPNSYGVLTFSKPGISDDGQRAVVAYTEATTASESQMEVLLEAGYYLMVQQGGVWMVEMEVVILQS